MSKAPLINFELWYTNDDAQDQHKIYSTLEHLIYKDIDRAIPIDTIFGLLLCEGFLYRNNEDFYALLSRVERYAKSKGVKKLYLIAGICEQYQQELDERNLDYTIIFWDYSVGCVWESYKNRLDQTLPWNPYANKFLFLTGVPSRPNRIGLLSKFYDKKLLSSSMWSFFPPWTDEDKQWCRNHLTKYSDIEYDEFINFCDQSVDDLYKDAKEYSRLTGKQWAEGSIKDKNFIKDPNWIDPDIFWNSNLSVISEGHVYPPANDSKFLTEKTWRAVVNKHPILLADSTDRYVYLQGMGLKTIDKYLSVPNYAYFDNYDLRMDAVTVNVEYFLNHATEHQEEIEKDIDHNFLRFLKIVKENEVTLKWLNTDFLITEDEIKKWFRQSGFTHLFREP
jgi:hypothetical protein